MLDKWNPKTMILIGRIGLSGLLLGFSEITSFGELKIFYLLYAIFLCFGGIITSMFLINKWFDKIEVLPLEYF